MRTKPLAAAIDAAVAAIGPQVIAWRRDLHANPELGNREFRTAGIVAAHCDALGFDEVRTGVAHTGVVGLLKGGRPGPVVALRADMDALPVTEEVDVPFASKVRATWNGEEVGVMHACGHDVPRRDPDGRRRVLAGLRDAAARHVKFIFQPAEEMPPEGEEGGAQLMIAEGALENPVPRAIFGLHVTSRLALGTIGYRPARRWRARTAPHHRPRQADARRDAVARRRPDRRLGAGRAGPADVVSRQVDIASEPAVVTIGRIKGGVRQNIIPDSVEMRGTIRTFDEAMRDDVHVRVTDTGRAHRASSRARLRRVHHEELSGDRERRRG